MAYESKYMKMAARVADEGITGGFGGPFGCVIVKNGEVIASTHNTVVNDNDPTAHGEVNAIRMACKKLGTFNLEGCELYTTSEPCPMCLGAIMWARIHKVYSAMNIADAKRIGFDDEPFYKAMTAYAKGEATPLLDMEFQRDTDCETLFNKYDQMDKVRY